MRVTAGQYRGRKLAVPKGQDIRPTADKIRQAIFNMLKSYDLPDGAVVLDGFCGTGALGLEALSRGAVQSIFIDKDTSVVRQNITTLNVEGRSIVLKKDITKCGPRKENIPAANLVFLDPPYRKNLNLPALTALLENGWLAPDAVCIMEDEKNASIDLPDGFVLRKQKTYGNTQILILTAITSRS